MHHFFPAHRNPSLPLRGNPVDLSPAGNGRLLISLVLLGALAALAWTTMDAGRYRALTLVLLGFFAFRVVLARLRARAG